jgi:hypothetical protein
MTTKTPACPRPRSPRTRIRLRIPHAELVSLLFGGDDTANHRSNWFALLGITLAIILLSSVFGVGCRLKPPVIEPTAPPPTTTTTTTLLPSPSPSPLPTFSELRLTTDGSLFVRASDPTYRMRKCVSCCKETIGTGWPGLSLSEIDFLYNQGLCNLVHWRVGPFTSRNEPEWIATGGGAYVEDPVTGRADLTQFNQPYWDALYAAGVYAGERRMNLEVSLLDGWSVKTKCWRSNAAPGETCAWHPWHPAGNIQGIDQLTTSWRGTDPSPVHLAYLNKIFETLCPVDPSTGSRVCLQNVIFEDGTEPDQLVKVDGRYDTEIVRWSLTQEALLRQFETSVGSPRHLYGTNFPGDASYAWLRKGRFEYQNIHRMSASATPYIASTFFDPSDFLRPLVMDEYNPEPPMLALDVEAFACYTAARGAYWAAWRHDQDVNQWKATLSLIARDSIDGCSEKMLTGCPYDVPEVSRVDCKRHAGNLYDCTPKSSRGPILPEGKIARGLCEQFAAGLAPGEGVVWSATPQNAITVLGTANRWQFRIAGEKGAKGTLHCRLPKIADACNALALEVQ